MMRTKIVGILFFVGSIVFSTAVFANVNSNLILGRWTCNVQFTDVYDIKITSEHQFAHHGHLQSSADVVLSMPKSTISVGYHLSAEGNWQIKNNDLTVKGKVTSIKNTLNPEWDTMLGLQHIIPDTLKGRVKIVHLDAHSLILDDPRVKRNYSCSK